VLGIRFGSKLSPWPFSQRKLGEMVTEAVRGFAAVTQHVVLLLTTKAEYILIIKATKLLYWWKRIFRDINFNLEEDLKIHYNNSLTVNLLSKETTMVHTKL
jgi:hypothetical protein